MKCPECGFVGYPGSLRCKNCGHVFEAPPALSDPPTAPARNQPKHESKAPDLDSFIPFSPPLPAKKAATEVADQELAPNSPPELPQAASQTAAWLEELADRLEDFRRKRSRIKGNFDPNSSLDLDFEKPPAEGSAAEQPDGI